jgi:hypothetical protein
MAASNTSTVKQTRNINKINKWGAGEFEMKHTNVSNAPCTVGKKECSTQTATRHEKEGGDNDQG